MDVGKQGLVSVSCGLLYGNRWGCEYMAVSNVIDVVTKSSVVMYRVMCSYIFVITGGIVSVW